MQDVNNGIHVMQVIQERAAGVNDRAGTMRLEQKDEQMLNTCSLPMFRGEW